MKTIMIVDDSLIMRINLKKIFEKHGYQIVAEAADGQEAIEKYRKFQPDLVTMDITMPVLDGITSLQSIREINPQACVVMISALGQEKKIIEALNKGARHYIIKPFKENDVIGKVTGILDPAEEEPCHVFASRS